MVWPALLDTHIRACLQTPNSGKTRGTPNRSHQEQSQQQQQSGQTTTSVHTKNCQQRKQLLKQRNLWVKSNQRQKAKAKVTEKEERGGTKGRRGWWRSEDLHKCNHSPVLPVAGPHTAQWVLRTMGTIGRQGQCVNNSQWWTTVRQESKKKLQN